MIREYQSNDLEQIMTIWLQANEQAHDFISPDYFRNHYDLVRLILPRSTVFVQDLDGIKGFIGLTDHHISGLFVEQHSQRKGIGKSLIQKAKQLNRTLTVNVYKKNTYAVDFYLSQGFDVISETINEETNQIELLMQCNTERTIKIGRCAL